MGTSINRNLLIKAIAILFLVIATLLFSCKHRIATSDSLAHNAILAEPGDFPGNLRLGSISCTGSKIDEQHILTAAHCVKHFAAPELSESATRDLSISYLTSDGDKFLTVKPLRVIYHSSYSLVNTKGWVYNPSEDRIDFGGEKHLYDALDLAIIKVDRLPNIPNVIIDTSPLSKGDSVVAQGYGCNAKSTPLSWHTSTINEELPNGFKTSTWNRNGQPGRNCQGDSGGAVYKRIREPMVVGVNSVGHTQFKWGVYFIRFDKPQLQLKNWIRETTRDKLNFCDLARSENLSMDKFCCEKISNVQEYQDLAFWLTHTKATSCTKNTLANFKNSTLYKQNVMVDGKILGWFQNTFRRLETLAQKLNF